MDACNAVEKEVDKVVSKMQGFKKYSNATLQELIDSVSQMERDFESGSDAEMTEGHALVLKSSIQKIKDVTAALTTQHRELHGTVSRVGKAIDKNFSSDFAAASKEGLFDDDKSQAMVNQVVCEYFLRKGYLDIAEELMSEANMQVPENYKEPFSELNRILEALRQKNVQPALQWAAHNRIKLIALRSQLELKLHRLQFLNLLSNGASFAEALEYARQNFQHLAERHEKDVQALMGCLLYMNNGGLQQSPYARFLDNSLWTDICQVFVRDACALLGLSVESPLAVCVNAGCKAVPSLLSIKQVMQQRQVNMWCAMDELPVEIHLGPKCQFHSIFACPILRQQSSDHNPPMRLVCGHVVSRDALHKLASSTKLKCPYCPMEQNPNDAREIHF